MQFAGTGSIELFHNLLSPNRTKTNTSSGGGGGGIALFAAMITTALTTVSNKLNI